MTGCRAGNNVAMEIGVEIKKLLCEVRFIVVQTRVEHARREAAQKALAANRKVLEILCQVFNG